MTKASRCGVELSKKTAAHLGGLRVPRLRNVDPKSLLKLAQSVVKDHSTITEAAKHYMVSWPTAKRWSPATSNTVAQEWGTGHPVPAAASTTPRGTGQTHRCPVVAQADGRGADRSQASRPRPCTRPSPLPDQPAELYRPHHQRTNPPLRTDGPGRNTPYRCHQVRGHPRRRRPPLPWQGRRRYEVQNLSRTQRLHPFQQTPSYDTAYVNTVSDDYSRVAYAEIHAMMRKPSPPSPFSSAQWPGSPRKGSPRNGSSLTTDLRTSPTPGKPPAPTSASPRNDPAPTGRQNRTIPPNSQRRLGLRQVLRHRNNPQRSSPRLDPLLQSL